MSIKESLKKTVVYDIYIKNKYMIYPLVLKNGKIDKTIPKIFLKCDIDAGKKRLIVSLTSFPERIGYVHKTIYSLFNQDYKPDLIVLCLTTIQFPNRELDLPEEILELQKLGLTIEWVNEDIRSYKKLIPIMEKYPDDIIVTADDDLYYPRYWLQRLMESYQKYPNEIHCHLVTPLKKNGTQVSSIKRYNALIDTASYNNKILGGSGTLYPPGSLHGDVLKRELFLKLAPTSDDIWFWAMALRNGTKIRWIKGTMKKLYYVEYSQEKTNCLCKVNDGSEGLFAKHLNNVVEKYNLDKLLE